MGELAAGSLGQEGLPSSCEVRMDVSPHSPEHPAQPSQQRLDETRWLFACLLGAAACEPPN